MYSLSLEAKILAAYLAVLIAANIIGGVTTIVVEQGHVESTTSTVSDILTDRELSNVRTRSTTILASAGALFEQFVADLMYQHDYAVMVYSDSLPVVSYYTNYNVEDYPSPAPPDVTSAGVSYNYSFWYRGNTTASVYLDKSSLLDNSHGTLVRANGAYAGMYIGFEDGLWRHLPYLDVGNNLATMQYTCYDTGAQTTGYDPRCRGWYSPATDDPSNVQYSSPYEDASTGAIMITLSKAVTVNSAVIGVVGADVTLDSLSGIVLSATILEHGYTYICDSQSRLIVHPALSSPETVYTVTEIEFDSAAEAEIAEFNAILTNRVLSGQTGQTPFTKNGELWYVTYGPVTGTGYYVLMVVPESDVIEPAVSVEEYGESSINALVVVVVLILLFVVIVGGYMTRTITHKVTEPVRAMTRVLFDIAENRLDNVDGMQSRPYSSTREVEILQEKIGNLFMAIKFSTDAYYKADYRAALMFLQEVEDMFTAIEQNRALGVIHNNRGNILRKHEGQGGTYTSALECLSKAVNNIRAYCAQASRDLESATQANDVEMISLLTHSLSFFRKTLASRLSNYGDCLREAGQLEGAERALAESIDLYQGLNHLRGLLRALGNRGLLRLEQGRVADAEAEFQNALTMANAQLVSSPSDETMGAVQFGGMNMGLFHYKCSRMHPAGSLERRQGVELALLSFYNTLSVSNRIHKSVLDQVLVSLKTIFEEDYDDAVAQVANSELGAMYPRLEEISKGGSSTIHFLIDLSVSMQGSRILSCQSTLTDIVQTRMRDGDALSIRGFAADLTDIVPLSVLNRGSRADVGYHIDGIVNQCTVPRTYFYKCLLELGRNLVRDGNGPHWVVSLTDGGDNERKTRIEDAKKFYEENGINLIIVSVGLFDSRITQQLQYLATEDKYYIKAGADPASITDALQAGFNVAMTGGNVVMEAL